MIFTHQRFISLGLTNTIKLEFTDRIVINPLRPLNRLIQILLKTIVDSRNFFSVICETEMLINRE